MYGPCVHTSADLVFARAYQPQKSLFFLSLSLLFARISQVYGNPGRVFFSHAYGVPRKIVFTRAWQPQEIFLVFHTYMAAPRSFFFFPTRRTAPGSFFFQSCMAAPGKSFFFFRTCMAAPLFIYLFIYFLVGFANWQLGVAVVWSGFNSMHCTIVWLVCTIVLAIHVYTCTFLYNAIMSL